MCAQCVSLSACGSFALIGTEDGRIEKYNMQSGFLRGSFGDKKAKHGVKERHTGPVLGLACDGLNRTVVSAGYDKAVKVFREILLRDLGC